MFHPDDSSSGSETQVNSYSYVVLRMNKLFLTGVGLLLQHIDHYDIVILSQLFQLYDSGFLKLYELYDIRHW